MRKIVFALIALCIATLTVEGHDHKDHYTLIKNARIFDGYNETLTEGDILVRINIIEQIGIVSNLPDHYNVIDAKGKIVTPGFIDAHTHTGLIAPFDKLENEYTAIYVGAAAGQMAENMLMRGFTTVRDAGGASIGVQRAIDDGWFPGPRVFSSGAFITQTSGHLDMRDRTNTHHNLGGSFSYAQSIGHYTAVDGVDEMLAATRQNFRGGATQIKLATNGGISAIYSPLDLDQFTNAELQAAKDVVESFDSYFMVHAYYDNAVSRAIDYGAKSIEHGHMMSEEVVKKMAEQEVFLVVEAFMSVADAPPSFTKEQQNKFNEAKAGFTGMIEHAKKHNVKIAFGSDMFLSKEMYALQAQEWVARSKLFSPLENLRQATSYGAELIEFCGERNRFKEGPLGKIEVGAYADILIIEGNPLEDITILANPEENIKMIMKDGQVYKNTLGIREINK